MKDMTHYIYILKLYTVQGQLRTAHLTRVASPLAQRNHIEVSSKTYFHHSNLCHITVLCSVEQSSIKVWFYTAKPFIFTIYYWTHPILLQSPSRHNGVKIQNIKAEGITNWLVSVGIITTGICVTNHWYAVCSCPVRLQSMSPYIDKGPKTFRSQSWNCWQQKASCSPEFYRASEF